MVMKWGYILLFSNSNSFYDSASIMEVTSQCWWWDLLHQTDRSVDGWYSWAYLVGCRRSHFRGTPDWVNEIEMLLSWWYDRVKRGEEEFMNKSAESRAALKNEEIDWQPEVDEDSTKCWKTLRYVAFTKTHPTLSNISIQPIPNGQKNRNQEQGFVLHPTETCRTSTWSNTMRLFAYSQQPLVANLYTTWT